jgi:catechol 2,3-dioxygenase-like lactoylglutathione lyase family enzyme
MPTQQEEMQTNSPASAATGDMKFEIVVIPVSDIDRAKAFYGEELGWRLDADYDNGRDFRVIQFTPPGSGCSVIFGRNVTAAAPGSAQGLYLIVSDLAAARAVLAARGIQVSQIFHSPGDTYSGPDEPYLFGRIRAAGPDPENRSYRSFASFRDPDGNGWLLQQITSRLPGRVTGGTAYASAADLTSSLKRAAAAHGRHEAKLGKPDPNWPEWYAEYMVREQSGEAPPE